MKGMALEVVVKWIILTVVALVVISLVIYFSNEIKQYLKGWMKEKVETKAEIVESQRFSTSQVITYIKACWDKTGEKFEEDMVCYILKGDVSEVNAELLKSALEPPAQVDVSKFDNSKTTTIISFENVGNIIHVVS